MSIIGKLGVGGGWEDIWEFSIFYAHFSVNLNCSKKLKNLFNFFCSDFCVENNRVDRVDSQRSFSKIIEIGSKTVMNCIKVVTVELEMNRFQA